jgi:hypothetical protein
MDTWHPIETAPKDASEFRARMADGTVHEKVHWAEDMSGSEQPPFRGWFRPHPGGGFVQIDEPKEWQPIRWNQALPDWVRARVETIVSRWRAIADEEGCPNLVRHEGGHVTCHAPACPCFDRARREAERAVPAERG